MAQIVFTPVCRWLVLANRCHCIFLRPEGLVRQCFRTLAFQIW